MKCKWITVEPTLVIYALSSAVSTIVVTQLIYEKSCHPHERPEYGADCPDTERSQKLSTGLNTLKSTLGTLLAVVPQLYAGLWSDRNGKRRKPLIYVSLLGQLLSDALCLFASTYWPTPILLTVVVSSILIGLTGNRALLNMAAVSYLVDHSKQEDRTFRLAIAMVAFLVGTPVGIALSGPLIKHFGYAWIFASCLILDIFAFVCTFMFVMEKEAVNGENGTAGSLCYGPFYALVKPRKYYHRAIVILMIISACSVECALQGESGNFLYYVKYVFNLDNVSSGYYLSYRIIVILIGSLMAVMILSKMFKVEDLIIGIVATSLSAVSSGLNIGTTQPWQLFAYPLIDCMRASTISVCKSTLSKVVDQDEVGQIMSAYAVFDSVFPTILNPLYGYVYTRTLTTHPGAYFLVTLGVSVLVTLFLSVSFFLLKKVPSRRYVITPPNVQNEAS